MSNRRHCLGALAALSAAGIVNLPLARAGARTNADTLVVFHSRTGETAAIAEFIARATNAEVLRIEPLEPYAPAYRDMTNVAREEKRLGRRREIQPVEVRLDGIRRVFIGSPVWWGGLSTPMWTFLSDHKFAGLKAHTFHTSGSSSPSASRREAEKLCPEARFSGDPFISSGGDAERRESDVLAWLRSLS